MEIVFDLNDELLADNSSKKTVGATEDEILRESWKFTTSNGGASVRVRGK